jgi:hypothetical protein
MTNSVITKKIILDSATRNIDDFLVACIVKYFYPKSEGDRNERFIILLESNLPEKVGGEIIMILERTEPLDAFDKDVHFRGMRFSSLFEYMMEDFSPKQTEILHTFDKTITGIRSVIRGEKLQNLVRDFGKCTSPECRLAIASYIVNTVIEENS